MPPPHPMSIERVEKLLDRTIKYQPSSRGDAGYEDLRKQYLGKSWVDVHAATEPAAQQEPAAEAADIGQLEEVDPSKVLFAESQLEPEWKTRTRAGTLGLENLGNSCFLNSTLQCLLCCPILANYLQSGHHGRNCSTVGFCAFCELAKVSTALSSGSGRDAIRPKGMVLNVRTMGRQFRRGRQEDAHEFLRCLLDSMQKACLRMVPPKQPRRVQETTAVHSLFGGHLRSQVKCKKCGHCSNKYEAYLDLSLDIAKKADSIDRAMQNFTAAEQLNGDNQYRCEKCDTLVDAAKRLTLHTLPKLLTVQLKRFGGGGGLMGWAGGGSGQKINKQISFPASLDLQRYTSAVIDAQPDESQLSKKQKKALKKKRKRDGGATLLDGAGGEGGSTGGEGSFSLCGVVVHHGYSVHSGHYVAYIKAPNQMWFQMDDEEVSQVKKATVLKQQAYLLFYKREGWTPPAPVSRADQEAEAERLAAAELQRAEDAKRKRRRMMSSSDSDSSGSEDSGSEDQSKSKEEQRNVKENEPAVPKRVPIDSLDVDQGFTWHPLEETNMVYGRKRAAGFHKSVAAYLKDRESKRAKARAAAEAAENDGDSSDIDLDGDSSDVDLSEDDEGTGADTSAAAAAAEENQPESTASSDSQDTDEDVSVLVVTSSRQRRRSALATAGVQQQKRSLRYRICTISPSTYDAEAAGKRQQFLKASRAGRPQAHRRGYTHDLMMNGSLTIQPVVRRQRAGGEGGRSGEVAPAQSSKASRYVTEMDCSEAKPVVTSRQPAARRGAGDSGPVAMQSAAKASSLDAVAAARAAATVAHAEHTLAAQAEAEALAARAAAMAGPRVDTWEHHGQEDMGQQLQAAPTGRQVAAAVAKQQYETSGRQHRKERDKYDAEYDAPKVRKTRAEKDAAKALKRNAIRDGESNLFQASSVRREHTHRQNIASRTYASLGFLPCFLSSRLPKLELAATHVDARVRALTCVCACRRVMCACLACVRRTLGRGLP
jgi:ubiquitin carboxyl-terminal hydrolase 36/42